MQTVRSTAEVTDENSLAAHAAKYDIRTQTGFNDSYADRSQLTISEQLLINKYHKTIWLECVKPCWL